MIDILINIIFVLGLIIAGAFGAWKVYNFTKLPQAEQLVAIKQWLIWAVAEAEKLYGTGTGALKLRYVYDMFLTKFNYLADVITFEDFSKMVDESLEGFRDLLNKNDKINSYVEGLNEEAK